MPTPAFADYRLNGRLLLAALLMLLSTGCQSGGPLAAIDKLPAEEKIRRADALVLDAAGATATQRLLTAAQLYNGAQAHAKALAALERIDPVTIERGQRGDFLNTMLDAMLGTNNSDGAWRTVARPPAGRYAFVAELEPAEAAQLALRRAALLEQRGDLSAALRERIGAQELPTAQRHANEDLVWTTLLRIGRDPLRQLESDADATVRAWANLARMVREGGDSPALLASRVDSWMLANPQHPAARRPPANVRQVLGIKPGDGPLQVAILLPQHGKLADAGTAIERGILAAWFQARESGATVPLLRFYDASVTDFAAVYDRAIEDGAQRVIGPLAKEHIKVLQARKKLPVPTLALNYPDGTDDTAGLTFFGLSGEQEADQIARAALAAGYRRGAVLVPAGEWGERMTAQLAQSLRAGGGELRASGVFQGNGDYSNVVRNLLEIATSDIRHNKIERVTGLKLGFEPQRRQDIDCLFIIGNTLQGTQLVPALQYHHAGNLPLFATSQINGQATAANMRDLAAIRFVEMPWLADQDQPLRERIGTAWKNLDARYQPLYALGVDAWRLTMQLPAAGQEIDGVTGALSMDPNHQIRRRLNWLVYRDGVAEPIDGQP